MLRRLLIKIVFCLALNPFNAISQKSDSLEVICDELFLDILVYYENVSHQINEDEWIVSSIKRLEDSTSYHFIIGNSLDTLIMTQMLVSRGRILIFEQFFKGRMVGVNIRKDMIASKNPFQWEEFAGYTRSLMRPISNTFVLFGYMMETNYQDYHCIKCITEKKLLNRLLKD